MQYIEAPAHHQLHIFTKDQETCLGVQADCSLRLNLESLGRVGIP